MANFKYRNVLDLYVTGVEHRLKNGQPVWVQVLSPFEQQEAKSQAQIARARKALALRQSGSGEQEKVRSLFVEEGPQLAIRRLVEARATRAIYKVMFDLRADPDWKERLAILDRGTDYTATPLTAEEKQLVENINQEYTEEIGRRHRDEQEFEKRQLEELEPDQLWKDYLDWWVESQGDDAALEELRLCKVLYGTRACEGVEDDGKWDHEPCEGHKERVFDSRKEITELPGDLLNELFTASQRADMTENEAKNSDRQMSSSGSSHLPSEAAESTASSPDAILTTPPGISASQSDTP